MDNFENGAPTDPTTLSGSSKRRLEPGAQTAIFPPKMSSMSTSVSFALKNGPKETASSKNSSGGDRKRRRRA